MTPRWDWSAPGMQQDERPGGRPDYLSDTPDRQASTTGDIHEANLHMTRPSWQGRGAISLGLTLAAVTLTACSGGSTPATGEPVVFPSAAPGEISYLAEVRTAGLLDDNETLLAVGADICYEIQTQGESWMLSNFAESSFTKDQQAAIVRAAKRFLCSPPVSPSTTKPRTMASAAPTPKSSPTASAVKSPHKGSVAVYARMVNGEAKWVLRALSEAETCFRDPTDIVCDEQTPEYLASFTGYLNFRLMSSGNPNLPDAYLGTSPKVIRDLIIRTEAALRAAKIAAMVADEECGMWMTKPRCRKALRAIHSANAPLTEALREWRSLHS